MRAYRPQVPVYKCKVEPLNDSTPYYEWFWRNLSLTLGIAQACYPNASLRQLVDLSTWYADKHTKDNIYCFWHGRAYSANGECPCEGCPAGVHDCNKVDRPHALP